MMDFSPTDVNVVVSGIALKSPRTFFYLSPTYRKTVNSFPPALGNAEQVGIFKTSAWGMYPLPEVCLALCNS